MNKFNQHKDNDFLLSFSDFKQIIIKNKKKIYFFSFLFSFLFFLFGLYKPIQYEVTASFQEKSKSKPNIGESLSFMLLTEGQSESDALKMMQSRQLLEVLVKNENLQATLTKDEYLFPLIPFNKIKNNLITEYALLTNSLFPINDEIVPDIQIKQIVYNKPIPTHLSLKVISNTHYSLFDTSNRKIAEGIFGVPLTTNSFVFTLFLSSADDLKGNKYFITLFPLEYMAKILSKKFTLTTDKKDTGLIQITHVYGDKQQAANNVNALMKAYLDHIQSEHEDLCRIQIDYLKKRQYEMGSVLQEMMQAHAEKLSSDISTTGFSTSEKAMEFLASNQHHLKEKLFSVNLERQRFEKLQNELTLETEIFSSYYDLSLLNGITAKKRALKQQSASLLVALNNTPKQNKSLVLENKNFDETKQGLDLNVAQEIYVTYVKELSEIESRVTQNQFMIDQIEDVNFEITSLSSLLSDPISMDLIVKTGHLLLALKDYDNRSGREQDRLMADIVIQKNFLKSHLKQSMDLLYSRQNFVREKIIQLQKILLSLIEEQIIILDIQLKEYIANILTHLHREKNLIEENLSILRNEMSLFPEQWAAEQLISQQMSLNKALVEDISKVMESKNITNNLEKFLSTPIDKAIPSIHPKSPHLYLLGFLGFIFGSFITSCVVLSLSILKGIKATNENLKEHGLRVMGSLQSTYHDFCKYECLLDNDLDTLRRIMATIPNDLGKTVLLLEGEGPDYSQALAWLGSKKGWKSIVINLDFTSLSSLQSTSGLLQYLEGKINFPSIVHKEGFDFIPSGGISRFSNEYLTFEKFQPLLSKLSENYDLILVTSPVSVITAEGESLIDLFPNGIVSLKDETVEELKSLFDRAKSNNKMISFIFV